MALLLLALPGIARAETATIDDQCALADAIRAANTGEAVGGCPAGITVITLTGDVILTAPVAVDAEDEDNADADGLPLITTSLIIEGNGYAIARAADAPPFRLLHVGEGGDLTLRGVTLRGGVAATAGGGLLVDGGRAVVEDSVFVSNRAQYGGGLAAINGALTVRDTTFDNNQAGEAGGGAHIRVTPGASVAGLMLEDVTFISNVSGGSGGGLHNQGGTLEVSGALFVRNTSGLGGGAANVAGGDLLIVGSGFQANLGSSGGGGLYNAARATVRASAFWENLSRRNGGGIWNTDDITLVNVTLSGNTATNIGGGIASSTLTSRARADNITVYGNIAGSGGGITKDGIFEVNNSIIIGNAAQQCLLNTGVEFSGRSNRSDDVRCPNTQPLTGLDPELANNGGPTPTHALLPDSSAINAGSPALCPSTDQRFAERLSLCDIGAYEFGGEPEGDYLLDRIADADLDADEQPTVADLCPADPGPMDLVNCPFRGTVDQSVNLRNGPGTGFRVLATVRAGDELVILGRSDDTEWLRVQAARQDAGAELLIGWIFAPLVITDASTMDLPVIGN